MVGIGKSFGESAVLEDSEEFVTGQLLRSERRTGQSAEESRCLTRMAESARILLAQDGEG